MEAMEHKVDKAAWGHGPWENEPDLENFQTADGLGGSIVRNSVSGHLCGYVGVPATHPWHGKHYSDVIAATDEQMSQPVDPDRISLMGVLGLMLLGGGGQEEARIDCLIGVHGGLTYSNVGNSAFGKDPSMWYFGFDCAHYGDACPGHSNWGDGTYRDIDFVRAEVAQLSKQLAAVAAAPATN